MPIPGGGIDLVNKSSLNITKYNVLNGYIINQDGSFQTKDDYPLHQKIYGTYTSGESDIEIDGFYSYNPL